MLSNSCRYAIRALIYIASRQKSAGKTGIKTISEALELPTPYLAKILQQLAKHKILHSAKGPHGGFSMLRDPKKVTLFDVIEIIDGNDFFGNCIIHSSSCSFVDKNKLTCPLHDDYSCLREGLVNLFKKRTIYDLSKKINETNTLTI
jgi:Rrf2 family transcriptional regulator, iron-sulfur cluster assembly transcription factor